MKTVKLGELSELNEFFAQIDKEHLQLNELIRESQRSISATERMINKLSDETLKLDNALALKKSIRGLKAKGRFKKEPMRVNAKGLTTSIGKLNRKGK